MSEEKGLLLAEAIWTRYMPSRKMIDDLVESGVIGKVTSLTANLGYVLPHVERLQERLWRAARCWIWEFIPSTLL